MNDANPYAFQSGTTAPWPRPKSGPVILVLKHILLLLNRRD
jgi:hypothetical protein